jgi:hypothetical protein
MINLVRSAENGSSLIQGPYGIPGNFKAVVPKGKIITHYWRYNSGPQTPWYPSASVSIDAISTACLIQSTIFNIPGDLGNLEVVVQESEASSTTHVA